jgi:predicted O-linked N-acetylglucosamine transferase (SPINDLY family)
VSSVAASRLDAAWHLYAAGRRDDAERRCLDILSELPTQVDALALLARIQAEAGRRYEAIATCRRSLTDRESTAEALVDHADCLLACHEAALAQTSLRTAAAMTPRHVDAWGRLGELARRRNSQAEMLRCFRIAAALSYLDGRAIYNLGIALQLSECRHEAARAFRRTLAIAPHFVEPLNNLAVLQHQLGHSAVSVVWCRRGIVLAPEFGFLYLNLGRACQLSGDQTGAWRAFGQAIALTPDLPETYFAFSNTSHSVGDLEFALSLLDRTLALDGRHANAWSNRLLLEQYRPDVSADRLNQLHRRWYDRTQPTALPALARGTAECTAPLKIGLVSPDFGRHPVGLFLVGALEALNSTSVRAVCYSARNHDDPIADRLKRSVPLWRDVVGLGVEEVCGLVASDGIEVLIDLSGHTGGNRLDVFARRAAAVQASWAGYVGTTGLATMDWLICDGYHVPAGEEGCYVERVIRLPEGYVCYLPPSGGPEPGELPALARGYVTFGSLNNPAKLNEEVLGLWASVLRGVSGSRLLLGYGGMDDPWNRRRVLQALSRRGVGAERVELRGKAEPLRMLEHYREIDIALDPRPYSGGVTTLEALWMGVPVVTWPGRSFAGRHALSHLSNLGLTETVARDAAEYVAIAADLAQDLPRLGRLRRSLRPRLLAAPLSDPRRFAQTFTRALELMLHHSRNDSPNDKSPVAVTRP